MSPEMFQLRWQVLNVPGISCEICMAMSSGIEHVNTVADALMRKEDKSPKSEMESASGCKRR